jgi:L-fuconolactonase
VLIDAHQHLWDPARRAYPWMAEPGMEPLRRRFSVDDLTAVTPTDARVVLVQAVSSAEESLDLLETASSDRVAGVVGWVDLTADVAPSLEQLRAVGPLVGIRHQVHDEDDPDWLGRADVRRGLGCVAETGLAYDLLVRTRELPAAVALAGAIPDLHLVLDHCAKPPLDDDLGAWRSALEPLAHHDNVVCKISGLVTLTARRGAEPLRPAFETVLELFGPDRLLFGSDWPWCTLTATWDEVHAATLELLAPLSADERAAVLGGTARDVYAL